MTAGAPYGTVTDDELALLLSGVGTTGGDDIIAIDALLTQYRDDPRLHFLRGSILAAQGRALEAHQSLALAVQLAPDFAIARFQLGLFELTSGEPNLALDNWAHLDSLPRDHYLRHFVNGLRALIVDDFVSCMSQLKQGIAVNHDNPPLNDDMQLIIEQCRTIAPGQQQAESAHDGVSVPPLASEQDSEVSAAALLLNRFGPTGRPQ